MDKQRAIAIHVSLDEAREELAKRWQDEKLRESVESELGQYFINSFKDEPRGVIDWCLVSPNNSFTFFLQCANYVKCFPLATEYLGDTFITFNEEKAGLGRLRAYLKDGRKVLVDLIDFSANEKKQIKEIITKSGEGLVDFHHKLITQSGYSIELLDLTSWFRSIGKAKDYYYLYLLHFVAHGVIFENFVMEDDEESETETVFTHEIVLPAIAKIEQKYGLKPLNVRLYPKQQSAEEDFYWWCYPPHVNEYIINYAELHKLALRNWRNKRMITANSWMNPKLQKQNAGG